MTKTFKQDSIIPISATMTVVVDKDANVGQWYVWNGCLYQVVGTGGISSPNPRAVVAVLGDKLEGIPVIELPDETIQIPKYVHPNGNAIGPSEALAHYIGYVAGCKAAGGYSEEDMRNALKAGVVIGIDSLEEPQGFTRIKYWSDKEEIYLKSLKQPKQIVELELEYWIVHTDHVEGGFETGLEIQDKKNNIIHPKSVKYERISC
jgi:hypothetical protein